jgi:hypothetical protein
MPKSASYMSASHAGAVPANSIVKDAPKDIQDIIDRAHYVPTEFTGRMAAHISGTAGKSEKDGSVTIRVKQGRKPSKAIIVHEAVHAQQSLMTPTERDKWEGRFVAAATQDYQSVKNPLWSESMLWDGGEIWPTAAGFMYGGSPHLITESSPKVGAVLAELYGQGAR